MKHKNNYLTPFIHCYLRQVAYPFLYQYHLNMAALNSEVKNLHQALTGQLLPKSAEINNHIRDFLNQEVKDFEEINRGNDRVYEQLRSEWEQYNKIVTDLKTKKNKDNKFIEGGAGYLKAKEEQIKSKNKILESINTGMKESVTKVNPEKLSKLPYEKEIILKDVFSTLYFVLYNEAPEKFDWIVFKKLALLHHEGEDFVTRLANLNFKDLSQAHYDALRVLKNDQKFKDVCENSTYAFDVVDIADWVDYVVEGHKISLQKKASETDYDKIRKDIDKRSDGSLQLKEEFCNQTLKDIDHYQNTLTDLQSQLRNLIIEMNNGVSKLRDNEGVRNQKIKNINKI